MPKSVLFIAPYIPDRIRVRPHNFIRSLANRGHKVTLLAIDEGSSSETLDELDHYCHRVIVVPLTKQRVLFNLIRTLPGRTPLQAVYAWNPDLIHALERTIPMENWSSFFDVIHIEHLRGVRFGLAIRELIEKSGDYVPTVWDSVDCITALFAQTSKRANSLRSRLIARLELARTRRYEKWLLPRFERVLVTSDLDRDALRSLSNNAVGQHQIKVVPNGVDLDYFKSASLDGRKPKTLIMTGKMSYHANVTMCKHFVENIFPLILNKDPEIELIIVGKDPPPGIRSLNEHPNITVTGTVPDVRRFLGEASIAVIPLLYGVGIQNKVLEALAMGTPVVSTSIATSALQIQAGKELIVADEPAAFAASIIDLLNNPERRNKLSKAGRHYVEQHHDWGRIAAKLEGIYKDVINR